ETKLSMPGRLKLLSALLGRLVEKGALASEDEVLAEGLLKRLDDVYDYLRSCGPVWSDRPRRIEATLPDSTAGRVAVDCHVLAGKALVGYFRGGAPERGAGSESCGERYFRAPHLTLSGLSNAGGRLLYTGVSHGFCPAHELTHERVAGLSDQALNSVLLQYRSRLVGRLYMAHPVPVSMVSPAARYLTENAPEDCERIRKLSADDLASWTRSLKLEARRNSYEDMVFAAILSDEARSRRMLAGQDAGVNLFSLALLAPGDSEAWAFQHDCLRRAEPVEFISRRDGDNTLTSLTTVDVNIRQCALSVEPERPSQDGRPALGWRDSERLLGPMDSPSPGGEAQAWLEARESLIAEAREAVAGFQQRRGSISRALGANCPNVLTMDKHLARERDDLENLEKQLRTFEDATRQLKTLWAEAGDSPAGFSTHRMAAARLALIGFLMGETPFLSCASGRDFIAPVEEELRFLATFADNQGGRLPPLDLPADLSREARKAFALP
ncbi:MAG: hypothetical protein OXC69_01470, partial [Candidatus Tectomicrobia bacterium]|nr:hypothetical protein [Candidatus Tectomicrobia bacterium]